MRILIVEDEFNTREGLASLIKKISPEYEICGKAIDGEEGYEMSISLKPDLIFVDIGLPKLNGLKMIEKILNSNQESSFIILSGCEDFQYAQEAIRYGVDEYLLKPITYEKLKSVIQNLGKWHNIKKINSNKKIIPQAGILRSIILNDKNDSSDAFYLIKETVIPDKMYIVNIYFGEDANSLDMNQVIDSFINCYTFKNYYISALHEYYYLTLFINTDIEISDIIKKINYILIFSLRKFKFKNYTVVLLPIYKIEDLSKALSEIQNLNSYGLTYGDDTVITPDIAHCIMQSRNNEVRKFEIAALIALKQENVDGLTIINHELLAFLKSSSFHPKEIIKICVDYAFSILVYYKEFKIGSYEKAQNDRILDKLRLCCKIEEIKDCLDKLVYLYKESIPIQEKVNSVLIKKMISYIVNSYIGKVSLEDFAAEMNVTPEYLSHLFTKEVGTSFSEYLKKYRIGIAKKIMLTSNYKIYEIGEKVGYKDPKYFCKMFKELTGLSPKEYMTMR